MLLMMIVARAAAGEGADVRGELERADAMFVEGAALLGAEPTRGAALLAQSAAVMERAAEDEDLCNGYLEYNIANANLLAGEVGRAIVHYRRAELLAVNDERVRMNLAEARSRVVDRVEASGGRQVARTVFFWHYDVPAGWRAAGLIGTWAAVWLGWAWCLLGGWSAARGWVIAAGVVGVCALGTSLVVEHNERSARREAVIVADSVIARTGPDEAAYGARFERPLHQGVEVRVEEERAGWVYVRLADGREAWVPASAIERV